MQDAKRKESAHGIIDDLTVGAVELSDSSEREGERNVLEKVGVSACIEVEVTFFLRIIAKVFLVLDAVVDVRSILGTGTPTPRVELMIAKALSGF